MRAVRPESRTLIAQAGARRRIMDGLWPRLAFWVLFLFGWRTLDVVSSLSGLTDTLEVLWGVQWYERCLLDAGTSPFYCNLIAHPHGWLTAILAYTSLLFLLMLPLSQFAGPAFAYNVLTILSLAVAFEGTLRLASRFTESKFAASLAGLVFAFVGMRWFRVSQGHLNLVWLSALLPWLLGDG